MIYHVCSLHLLRPPGGFAYWDSQNIAQGFLCSGAPTARPGPRLRAPKTAVIHGTPGQVDRRYKTGIRSRSSGL